MSEHSETLEHLGHSKSTTCGAVSAPLWSTADVAHYLGCKPNTVKLWRLGGSGPPYIKTGKLVRYKPDAVRNWADDVSAPVTEEDLRTGRRDSVNQRECARLTGRGVKSLERDRCEGKGMRFKKDNSGRVSYPAAEVIAYIDAKAAGKLHKSTNEYSTSAQLNNLETARAKAIRQRDSLSP